MLEEGLATPVDEPEINRIAILFVEKKESKIFGLKKIQEALNCSHGSLS